MDWSTELTTRRYLAGVAITLRPALYLPLIAVTVGIGLYDAGGAGAVQVVLTIVGLLLFVACLFCLALVRSLRRTLRAAGTNVIRYELDCDHLSVRTGQDLIQMPRDSLKVKRVGTRFIAVQREGLRGRTALLYFDDPGTTIRAAEALRASPTA